MLHGFLRTHRESVALLETARVVAGGGLVWKVAGAAAATGAPLDEVRRIAEGAVDRTRTIAVAHGAGTVPGSDHPAFTVAGHEYQFGVGHGEPGVSTETMAPV